MEAKKEIIKEKKEKNCLTRRSLAQAEARKLNITAVTAEN